jgi:hypothetical protein
MVQDVQQGQHMRPIAVQLGLPNIIHDHVSNLFALMRQKYIASTVEAISGRCSCSAMARTPSSVTGERDAIFKRDHVLGSSPRLVRFEAINLISPAEPLHSLESRRACKR